METYFKLGVQGEGFAFFLPDNYTKYKQIIGSEVRRSINGKAHRDVITVKHTYELSFDFLSDDEYKNFALLFLKNMNGQDLIFVDDEGEMFNVMWGSDSFGLSSRVQFDEVYWSGTISLEEI